MGEETCSVACVSVREGDLDGTRLLLPRGHARREKVRGRGSLLEFDPQADVFTRIVVSRFTRVVVSGAVYYRLRACKLSAFFTWCRERLSWHALWRSAQAIQLLAAPVGPLMCRFCLWLIRSPWTNDARAMPRGRANRRLR